MVNEPDHYTQFRQDMTEADFDVQEYGGRNYYQGPATVVDTSEYQDVVRATSVRLQTDNMGKSGIVVYPKEAQS